MPDCSTKEVLNQGRESVCKTVAAVAIGRNEGARLVQCMDSLSRTLHTIVYVDSQSTDSSVEIAKSYGAVVVELDPKILFSAARARNVGVREVTLHSPEIEYVQLVDGDCQIQADWIEKGLAFLQANPNYAVVCGRRRERFPNNSIYNCLCDVEWDTPVGDALSCGGDALVRLSAFQQVGGFDDSVIAGEEPEMCVRLRKVGWKIMRLDEEMTLHDAAMMRLGQWWKRAKRAGYAYAQGAAMHGGPPERHWKRETRRIWIWAFWLPIAAIVLTWFVGTAGIAILAMYLILWMRVFQQSLGKAMPTKVAALWSLSCVASKFPQLSGQVLFWVRRTLGKGSRLIEYKDGKAT